MASITVQDLDIWQDSISLLKSVHSAVRSWPSKERDGIAAQALRISVSIPVSLADGRGRDDPALTRRFAQVAIGAAFELDTLLIIAAELGYQDLENISVLRHELAQLMRRIENFICSQDWKLR
jgi:four helix bundle protein